MNDINYQLDLLTAMNEKLAGKERIYRMICGMSSNAFIYYNFLENRIEVLGDFNKFFPFQINSLMDLEHILASIADEFVNALRDTLFAERKEADVVTQECCLLDGRTWLQFETTITYDKHKQPLEKIIRIRDITKIKSQNEELRYMAYYDMLTGLYNRNYFVRVLSEWIRRAETEQSVISVLCVDIDNFKMINDGLGLLTGDEVLQNFAFFLKSEIANENVIISHVNNDLFYIAIYEPMGSRDVDVIYHRIRERLQEPFLLTNHKEVKITVCVGVASYPEASKVSLELMNCAEIVMFKAKASGKDNIQYFANPMLADFKNAVDIEHKLKDAINEQQFELYYQPQFDAQTKKLRGIEALIRWRDSSGNMISPGVFIPIAEQMGMIVPIGNWVIDEGIRALSVWKKKYDFPLVLSINISAIQYKRKEFVHNLINALKENDISPSDIELEITESVLIDNFESVVEKLHILKEYGIKISLDDFGTGFSSLSYLKGLPIDTLKIDKSFIDTVTSDNSTKVITESIISMVKKLGCETVAEGVETQEQYEYLKTIDCDNIQGFLLGRPMPADKIDELICKESK